MRTTTTIAETRAFLDGARAGGATVGLVPTLGSLHGGHTSLMARAAADCDVVAVSVFVNPLQFGVGEDFAAYPRDVDADAEVVSRSGVDLLFVPSVEEMYPEPVRTTVSVSGLTTRLEGSSRPSHFAGVATVLAKLWNIVGPCRAYFGEKDWQQLAVVRRLAADLSFPVEVVACPTVREPDGLAMASRNAYLDPAERAAATVLHRALLAGVAAVEAGERDPAQVRATMAAVVGTEPLAELDYAEVVDATTLDPVDPLTGELRLLAAVGLGRARLIDNVGVLAD